MNPRFFILLLVIGINVKIAAQIQNGIHTWNNAALQQELFTAASNPSYFSDHKNSLGLYSQHLLGIAGINSYGIAGQTKFNKGQFAGSIYQNGTKNVNNRSILLGIGKKITETFNLGINLGWQGTYQTQNYGNLNQIAGGIFVNSEVVKNFSTSAYLQVTSANSLENSNKDMGSMLAYSPNERVKIGLTARVDAVKKGALGLWLKYKHPNNICFNMHASNSDEPLIASFSLVKKNWHPMLVYKFHNRLGGTVGLGIQWQN